MLRDPLALTIEDSSAQGEQRFVSIGMNVFGNLRVVVYAFRGEDVRIISVDGKDAGWLQAAELPAEIRLQKFFISPQFQRAGIGSEVLSKLLVAWRSTGKRVVLRVLKNNPARRLYERLGFSVTAEEDVTFRMRG